MSKKKEPTKDTAYTRPLFFLDLDKDSEYFSQPMSLNLKEFGIDAKYHGIDSSKITEKGKTALNLAKSQLLSWLHLDPYKLRRFIQSSCPWSTEDASYMEKQTEELMKACWDDPAQLDPLAQIMIRRSEHSRCKYLTIQNHIQENNHWYESNFGKNGSGSWDLDLPILNTMASNLQSLLGNLASGNLPSWIFIAECLSGTLKILALIAMQRERAEKSMQTMKAIMKSMSSLQTLIKKDLTMKQSSDSNRSSKAPLSEPISPCPSSPTTGRTSQNFPINSDNRINIINDINSINSNSMKSNSIRPELRPDEYLKNFENLCKTNGVPNYQALFRIFRECYTNPLCYLGPPRNMPDDYARFSRPLTVTKESWREKRIHSLEAKVCARCGGKGHTPVNCLEAIRCNRCGKEGHASNGCDVVPQKASLVEKEKMDSKSIKSLKNRKRPLNKKKRRSPPPQK